MDFFKRNILKIKSNTEDDEVRFYVNYYKLKQLDNFKMSLLKDMMGNNKCLAVINTDMIYNRNNKDNEKWSKELTDVFDKVDIKYNKIEIKKLQDIIVFGAVVKGTNKNTYKQCIIGFIIEVGKLESIKSIINNNNIKYYINNNVCSDDELLCNFQSKYNNEEDFCNNNIFDIFDDNFTKNIVIHSQSKNSQFIVDLLERLNHKIVLP
ncbi:MAG TPA: hypothetical protein VIK72_13200 [Clostridiaceae bacterium]